MKRPLTLFFLFMATIVHAQELTGVWQGHFKQGGIDRRPSIFDDRYKFEVQIAQHNKSFEAITYSYLSTLFYGKADAKGTVNLRNGKVILQEGKLLELRMDLGGGPCTMTCFLQYMKSGDEEFLEGRFSSMNVKDSTNCGGGIVFLRRVVHSDFYKEPFVAKREEEKEKELKKAIAKNREEPVKIAVAAAPKRPGTSKPTTSKPAANKPTTNTASTTPKNPPPANKPAANKPVVAATTRPPVTRKGPVAKPVTHPPLARIDVPGQRNSGIPIDTETGPPKNITPLILPKVLISRSNEVVKSIIVNTNEVTLNIYDDGAIDHDTISVYVDKKQVISHAMLTDRAIVMTLHLDETINFHEIIMVAENEGEIPPNTSLMIVKAGDKQYEVRITSTEQKNAVVTFKYEKAK